MFNMVGFALSSSEPMMNVVVGEADVGRYRVWLNLRGVRISSGSRRFAVVK